MSETQPLPLDPESLLRTDAFVRRLARSLIADPAAADDVAQQAWLAAVERPPADDVPLHGWFTTVVRRGAARLRRSLARRHERELAAARPESLDASHDYRERERMRRAVVDALFALEEPYRATLLLRFLEDLPPRKVAAQMEVPVETVRTRVKRGLALLRERLDALHANERDPRGAWLAGLIPLSGGLAVSLPAKVAAAAVALVAAAGLLWWTSGHDARPHEVVAVDRGAAPAVAEPAPTEEPTRLETETPASEVLEAAAPSPLSPLLDATGALDVRVVDARRNPLEGVFVGVQHARSRVAIGDPLLGITGSDGFCRFPSVAVGPVLVTTDRASGARGSVRSGELTDLTIRLDAEDEAEVVEISGLVVDGEGNPFEDAEIALTPPPSFMLSDLPCEPREVARSDAAGRFLLPRVAYGCYLGARAPGFAASTWLEVHRLGADSHLEVRLVLDAASADVAGRVVDERGMPVAGALVLIGDDLRWRIERSADPGSGLTALSRLSMLARTLGDGRFALEGLRAGREAVCVRAPGFAPWLGSIELREGEENALEIELAAGGRIEGFVRDASGAAVADAEVGVGSSFRFTSTLARSHEDGSFRLEGLTPGTIAVLVKAEGRGRCSAQLEVEAGTTLRWDARLDPGGTIRGTVRDAAGLPLARWRITARGALGDLSEPVHLASGWTDESGQFALEHLPAVRYDLTFADEHNQPVAAASRSGVEPGGEPLEVVVPDAALANAKLAGVILTASGEVPRGLQLLLGTRESFGSKSYPIDEATGRFEVGPLPPGRYFLIAMATGLPNLERSDVVVEPGRRTDLGELRFDAGASLQLRLQGEGIDLSGVLVTLHGRGGFTLQPPVHDGIVRAERLPPGRCIVEITGPGIAGESIEYQVEGGATTERELTLRHGISLLLRIRPPATPIPAGAIPGAMITPPGTFAAVARATMPYLERSAFDWRVCLAPGTYTVRIFLGPSKMLEQELVVRADDDRDRIVEIEIP